MPNKNIITAENYYKAMQKKDLSALAECLHPDIYFTTPLGEATGKEAMLATVGRFMTMFETLTVRGVFGADDQAMVAYDVDFPAPIGLSRAAAFMKFKDGLIFRLELFYDGRPFEQKKSQIFGKK